MEKIVKKKKKIIRRQSRRKEVEIPVFVISKKERAVAPRIEKEKEKIGIFKDGEDLPVFKNFYSADRSHGGEEKDEEEIRGELERLKNISQKKEPEVLAEKPKSHKQGALLSEKRKRIIMWGSVAVFACLIFFIWLSSLKNNFSDLLGSSSYTFLRADGILEEVEENKNMEEVKNQNVPSEEEVLGSEKTGSGEGTLDQIKEKILVEELKDKVQ